MISYDDGVRLVMVTVVMTVESSSDGVECFSDC